MLPQLTTPKNVNAYWITATGLLSSWFVFGARSLPPYILKRWDTRIHLFSSALTALSCSINLYGIPSSYSIKYRNIHKYIGTIGLIASLVGATAGMARLISIFFDNNKQISAQIAGLGYVGIYQVITTYKVYSNIKKFKNNNEKNGKKIDYQTAHIRNAHILFYGACLGPFWVRALDPNEIPMGKLAKLFQDTFKIPDTVMIALQIGGIMFMPTFLIKNSMRCFKQGQFI